MYEDQNCVFLYHKIYQTRQRKAAVKTKLDLVITFSTKCLFRANGGNFSLHVVIIGLKRRTSIRKPNVAVLEIVSRHTMYLGLVTPLALCSSSLGASGSIWIIFSYMSCREKPMNWYTFVESFRTRVCVSTLSSIAPFATLASPWPCSVPPPSTCARQSCSPSRTAG